MYAIGGVSAAIAGLILVVGWFSTKDKTILPMIIRSVFFGVVAYLHIIKLASMH